MKILETCFPQEIDIVLFFLILLFHSKTCVFFGTWPVGGLGGAVLSESDCMMHWVVVGTSRACLDIRLGIGRPWRSRGPAYSTSLACKYSKKSFKINGNQWKCLKINENQWKSSKFVENSWFSLIFHDSALSSSRLATSRGRGSGAWYQNTMSCYSMPQ